MKEKEREYGFLQNDPRRTDQIPTSRKCLSEGIA
jgi:hypothetical protein